MSNQPSIKKNYSYSMAYQVLALLVPFITIPYVARVLGADGVGTYSFSQSIVQYFMLVSALGVQGYGAREIARSRDNSEICSSLFWEISAMVGCTTFGCVVLWICTCVIATDYTSYFLAFTPMLVSVAFDISWFYIGLEKMGHVVLRNTIVKLLGLVLLFALVREADDLITYILINSCVQMAGNLSMWPSLRGLVFRPHVRLSSFRKHFRESLIYFVPALATSLYTVLDKTLIGAITGDPYQNGYYEQADKVIRMAMTLTFTSVNLVVGARLSYLFGKGELAEAKQRATRSLDFILLLGYGFAFGISGVADAFVPVFFGEGYEPVAFLLRMMCPLIVIIGTSNCLGTHYYTPSGRRAQSARYIMAGACANILLSLTLIPQLGMYGALIGSATAELLIAILYVYRCNGFIAVSDIWACSWKRLVAGVFAMLTSLGIWWCADSATIVVLLAECAAFAVVYAMLLAIMRDGMLKQVWGMAMRFRLRRRGK